MEALEQIRLTLKPIKTDKEYRHYLKLIDGLVDCPEGSAEEEVLELISILVEDYESEHYSIEPPDPIDAIIIMMQEKGLKRKDLVSYFGSNSRVSEVLNRKRKMTLDMARKLHAGLGISAEVLLS